MRSCRSRLCNPRGTGLEPHYHACWVSLATRAEGCPWCFVPDEEHGRGLYFPQVTTTARNNAVALLNVYPSLKMFSHPTSRYAEVVNDDTSELSYTLARLSAADELGPVAAEAEAQPDTKS
ncbi:hypothetical protein L1887_40462 [Cichorium endivia]|nr:hypothetical protein L1887_40462 [Cichorium endivia]